MIWWSHLNPTWESQWDSNFLSIFSFDHDWMNMLTLYEVEQYLGRLETGALVWFRNLKLTAREVYKLAQLSKKSVLLSLADIFARKESASQDPSWRKMWRVPVRHCSQTSYSLSINSSLFRWLWGSFSHSWHLHSKVHLRFFFSDLIIVYMYDLP